MCALSPSCNLHKAISLVNEICICATCSAKTFAFVSVMCDKLENQAFYANANAHRPPSGRCRQQQQQQCTFSLTSFYHFAFSPVCLLLLYVFFVFSFFFCFFYFLLHTVFANYSSKRNYSYATFSILIKTAAHTQFRSSSSFDIFVCLSKYL